MITTRACETLNEHLKSIFENTPYLSDEEIRDFTSFAVKSWSIQNPEHINRVIGVCHVLLDELLGYDPSFDVNGDIAELNSLEQIYKTIESRDLYFSATSSLLDYNIMNYLITEIRTAILAEKAGLTAADTSSTAMEVDSPRVSSGVVKVPPAVIYELNKLSTLLRIPKSSSNQASSSWEESFDQLIQYIDHWKQDYAVKYPGQSLTRPPAILSHIPPRSLTPDQYSKLRKLEQHLFQDFITRRKMLLQRLDVTLQTFITHHNLVITPTEEKQYDKKVTIDTQRRYLRDIPTLYTVEDALLAPVTLLKEQSNKISGEMKSGTKSIVKQVLVGNVPDRGGRVNELRHKRLEEPSYHKGRSQFKNTGGGNKGANNNKNNHQSSAPQQQPQPQQQENASTHTQNGGGGGNKQGSSSGWQNKNQRTQQNTNATSTASAAAVAMEEDTSTPAAGPGSGSGQPNKKKHYYNKKKN